MPAEHMKIYEAIAASDAEQARESAFNHIDQLKEMILRDDILNN